MVIAQAMQSQSRRPNRDPIQPLTLDILQQRLKPAVPGTLLRVINLRRLAIDLRAENAVFRDEFYRLLRSQLTAMDESEPISLDLSYSVIRGDLDCSRLGQQLSLYDANGKALDRLGVADSLQEQIGRDRRRLVQLNQLSRTLLGNLGRETPVLSVFPASLLLVQTEINGGVNWSNTFFLRGVEARGMVVRGGLRAMEARFARGVGVTGVVVEQEANFRNSVFVERLGATQVQFLGPMSFQGAEFRAGAGFNQGVFAQMGQFSRTRFQGNADFSQTRWPLGVNFGRSRFGRSLFLTNASLGGAVLFRQAQFNQPINLRGASLRAVIDFSDATFACRDSGCRHPIATVNLAGLRLDAPEAEIIGNPGQIGRVLSVPSLQDNETLLRNLVRSFRQVQQVGDANAVEYLAQRLRLRSLHRELVGTNLNRASVARLEQAGFSSVQAVAVAQVRLEERFRELADLLKLEAVDLATYVRVRDRLVTSSPGSLGEWVLKGLQWVGLSLLLLLSRYGSDVGLVFGVGLVAIAFFSVMFWLMDRVRLPLIRPTWSEAIAVVSMAVVLLIFGLGTIVRSAQQPWLTVSGLALVIGPLPLGLMLGLWQVRQQSEGQSQGLRRSYLVEDGSFRQLRIMIGRLPVVPRVPLFRDRYLPILWERRWGWLNYYDFSVNNWLRFGFNDVRLRDTQVPGWVTALVWYQWSVGLLYVALLLWTLSRTIPGLNLLIYFR